MSCRIAVVYYDPAGVPRAWAHGHVEGRQLVEREAARQLAEYRQCKAKVEDFGLARAKFKRKIFSMAE